MKRDLSATASSGAHLRVEGYVRRRVRINVDRVMVLGVVVAAATSLGSWWWVFDALGSFRAQYAVGMLAVAAAQLVLRAPRRALVAGALAAFHLAFVAPLYVGLSLESALSLESEHAPGSALASTRNRVPDLRILFANVHTANQEHRATLAYIRRIDPDVVVACEVNQAWAKVLEPLLETHPHHRLRPRRDNFGIALYSRLPFETAHIRTFGSADVPSVVATLRFGDTQVTLVGTHPLPPVSGRYAAWRNEQLRALAGFVATQAGEVVVVGDLNVTSWSSHFEDLMRVSGLRDSRVGYGVQATWPAGFPILQIPLDHCLVSGGLRVQRREVGLANGSDHSAIIVDLSVARGQGHRQRVGGDRPRTTPNHESRLRPAPPTHGQSSTGATRETPLPRR